MIWIENFNCEFVSSVTNNKLSSFLVRWLSEYQYYVFWLVRQVGCIRKNYTGNLYGKANIISSKNLLYFYSSRRLQKKSVKVNLNKKGRIGFVGFKQKIMKVYFIKLLKLKHKFNLVNQIGSLLFRPISIKKGGYKKRKKKFIWFLSKQLTKIFQTKVNKLKFLKSKSPSRIKNLQQNFFKKSMIITKRVIKQLSIFGLKVNREIFSRLKYGYGQYLVVKRMGGNIMVNNFLNNRFFLFFCKQLQLLKWLLNLVYLFSSYGLNESLKFLCNKLIKVKKLVGQKVEKILKIVLNVCPLNFYVTVVDSNTGRTIIKLSAGLVGFKGRRQKRRPIVLKLLVIRLVGFLVFLLKQVTFKNIFYRFVFVLKQSLISNKIDSFLMTFFYLLKKFNQQRWLNFDSLKQKHMIDSNKIVKKVKVVLKKN